MIDARSFASQLDRDGKLPILRMVVIISPLAAFVQNLALSRQGSDL